MCARVRLRPRHSCERLSLLASFERDGGVGWEGGNALRTNQCFCLWCMNTTVVVRQICRETRMHDDREHPLPTRNSCTSCLRQELMVPSSVRDAPIVRKTRCRCRQLNSIFSFWEKQKTENKKEKSGPPSTPLPIDQTPLRLRLYVPKNKNKTRRKVTTRWSHKQPASPRLPPRHRRAPPRRRQSLPGRRLRAPSRPPRPPRRPRPPPASCQSFGNARRTAKLFRVTVAVGTTPSNERLWRWNTLLACR